MGGASIFGAAANRATSGPTQQIGELAPHQVTEGRRLLCRALTRLYTRHQIHQVLGLPERTVDRYIDEANATAGPDPIAAPAIDRDDVVPGRPQPAPSGAWGLGELTTAERLAAIEELRGCPEAVEWLEALAP